MLCAALLHITGFLLLFSIRLPVPMLALLLASWLGMAWRDWRRQLHAYRQVRAIRADGDGGFAAIGPLGNRLELRLLAGSVVLDRIAWLRFELPDRTAYGELLGGNSRHCARWHWLQLCWRQRHGRFGRPDRS